MASAVPEIAIKLLNPAAKVPAYMSALAAGADLYAALAEPLTLEPGLVAAVPCGFAMAIPAGYEVQIRPRSGLALKNYITVANAPGTIDADYRGEVKVLLYNFGQNPFVIQNGMRIAQMVLARVERPAFVVTASLDETVRGSGGFGSTAC